MAALDVCAVPLEWQTRSKSDAGPQRRRTSTLSATHLSLNFQILDFQPSGLAFSHSNFQNLPLAYFLSYT